MKPWTILGSILAVILALAGIEAWNRAIAQHATKQADRRHAVVMDSVREANAWRDTVAVRALTDYARAKIHGDSLQKALAGLARRIRTRTLPGRVDTLLVPDTASTDSICMAGADGRALLVGDSARQVREDSLGRGWAACELDRAYQAQAYQTCKDQPPPSRVAAFSTGFALGNATGMAGCILLR